MEGITVVYLQGDQRGIAPEPSALMKDYACSDDALNAPMPEGYTVAFFQDGKDRYLFNRTQGWKRIARSDKNAGQS